MPLLTPEENLYGHNMPEIDKVIHSQWLQKLTSSQDILESICTLEKLSSFKLLLLIMDAVFSLIVEKNKKKEKTKMCYENAIPKKS